MPNKTSEKSVKAVKSKKPRKEKAPSDKLADKTAMTKFLQSIFGDAQKKKLKKIYKRVLEINKLEPKYEAMSDEELAKQTEVLREKILGHKEDEPQKSFKKK